MMFTMFIQGTAVPICNPRKSLFNMLRCALGRQLRSIATARARTAADFSIHRNLSSTASAGDPSSSSSLLGSLKQMGVHAYDVSKQTILPSLEQWSTTPGVLPVSVSVASCAAGWMILPRLLRRVHGYVEQGPTARLLGRSSDDQLPYHMSVWAAMEDPTRLFLTLIAFSQMAAFVAPSTVAEQYLGQVWNGGLIVSGIWFLHRWKTIFFSRKLAGKATTKDEQERYMAMDKISSVGMLILGAMSLAETSGVAVQSILTVGGIGGIATAFAARDILGNALTGLLLQFLKPFSVGDSITAGNIEGQVIEMGLHSTSLLNADKFPVVVPNSFFSSQIIVNKSRAPKQMLRSKIYLGFADLDKVPSITNRVVEMLKSHPSVRSEQEEPLCYVSKVGPTFLEVTLAYEVQPVKRPVTLEQQILIKAANIFTESGATLGAPSASSIPS